MKTIRITQKDIDAVYEAVDFIATNSDGALDGYKYYDELTRRLSRVWKYLSRAQKK